MIDVLDISLFAVISAVINVSQTMGGVDRNSLWFSSGVETTASQHQGGTDLSC